MFYQCTRQRKVVVNELKVELDVHPQDCRVRAAVYAQYVFLYSMRGWDL